MVYLTTQDLIWINSELARKPARFRVMDLEECVGYQYAYGSKLDPLRQAARFFEGLARRAPFDEGNEATALVAVLCFLRLNGFRVVQDRQRAAEIRDLVAAGEIDGEEGIRQLVTGTCPQPPLPLETLYRELEATHA